MNNKSALAVAGAGVLILSIVALRKKQVVSNSDIVFTELTILPRQAFSGEEIVITCTAMNNGTAAGTYEIVLGGDFMASKTITLQPGQSTQVNFSLTAPAQPGTYNINIEEMQAQFTVEEAPFVDIVLSNLSISPPSVYPGETVNISVTATNHGNIAGDKVLTLNLG